MTTKDPAAPGFKEKAKEELKDYLVISLYLAVFFCALVLYTKLILKQHDVVNDTFNYTFAIINALVIGKVILIGEMLHLGKRVESKPLYQSVFLKSIVFGLLTFAFHLIEEFVKRLIHHEPRGTVWQNMHTDQFIARSIIVFLTFLPLFAFRELRRVIGEKQFYSLFFTTRAADNPRLPARN